MRLLKTGTIKLHEYLAAQIPPYAVLSHGWEDGEVDFQRLHPGEGEQMLGYQKILRYCAQALRDGWDYVVSV